MDEILSYEELLYWVIIYDVSDYINLLVRIGHIICNHLLLYAEKLKGHEILIECVELYLHSQ